MLTIYMITSSLLIAPVTPQKRSLLRFHHDITMTLDNKCTEVLVLLDLSAAFDVINHGIIYERLEHAYGICNDALNWIQSYLNNRTQCVAVGSCISIDKHLNFGVLSLDHASTV